MYSDEYYLNQLSYFLVFIPIFARKYTIMITEELKNFIWHIREFPPRI